VPDRAVDLFASRAGEGFGSFYTLARDAMICLHSRRRGERDFCESVS
jgi:hypothetical protein